MNAQSMVIPPHNLSHVLVSLRLSPTLHWGTGRSGTGTTDSSAGHQ